MNETAPRRSEHSSDDLGRNIYLTGNFVCNKKSNKSSMLVLRSRKNSSCYKPRDCEHFNLGGQGVNPCQMEDFTVSLHYGTIQSFFLSCTVVLLHLGLFYSTQGCSRFVVLWLSCTLLWCWTSFYFLVYITRMV